MLDEQQRISILVIHNSEISNGWAREGEHEDYFKVFSEARAYPLGVDITFYLMTNESSHGGVNGRGPIRCPPRSQLRPIYCDE